MALLRYLAIIVGVIGCIGMCILGAIVFVPLVLLPERIRFNNRTFYRLSSWWARSLLWLLGIRYTVHCTQPLPVYPAQPSIIVANHASALDILLLEAIVGGYPHIWLSKDIYGYIPIFGFVLSRMHVLVNRSSVRAAAISLKQLYSLARGGSRHVFIFPEGTRHGDGRIHKFHHGFAQLSSRLQRPIRPIYIKNAHKVLAKGSIIANTIAHIHITVGASLVAKPGESEPEFVSRVRNWFVQKSG